MAVAGPLLAGTGANDASSGSNAWSNPGNITASDDSRATVTLANNTVNSQLLFATNFDFAPLIPPGSAIDGLRGIIERQANNGSNARDEVVRFLKAGVPVGTNLAKTALNWGTTDGTPNYPDSTTENDLAGTTWTRDEVCDPGFGLMLQVKNAVNASREYRVDAITIMVWYTAPSGTTKSGTDSQGLDESETAALAASAQAADSQALGVSETAAIVATLPQEPEELTVYAAASDGYLTSGDLSASYAAARAGTGDLGVTADTTGTIVFAGQRATATGFFVYEGFLQFDLSAALAELAGKVVVGTTLSLNLANDDSDTDFTVEARASDWGATLTDADYVAGDDLSGLALLASIATAGIGATGAYKALTSEAAFATAVEAAVASDGVVRLLLCSSRTVNGDAPTEGVEERIRFFSANNLSGDSQKPKLVITYSPAPPAESTDDQALDLADAASAAAQLSDADAQDVATSDDATLQAALSWADGGQYDEGEFGGGGFSNHLEVSEAAAIAQLVFVADADVAGIGVAELAEHAAALSTPDGADLVLSEAPALTGALSTPDTQALTAVEDDAVIEQRAFAAGDVQALAGGEDHVIAVTLAALDAQTLDANEGAALAAALAGGDSQLLDVVESELATEGAIDIGGADAGALAVLEEVSIAVLAVTGDSQALAGSDDVVLSVAAAAVDAQDVVTAEAHAGAARPGGQDAQGVRSTALASVRARPQGAESGVLTASDAAALTVALARVDPQAITASEQTRGGIVASELVVLAASETGSIASRIVGYVEGRGAAGSLVEGQGGVRGVVEAGRS